MNTKEDFLNLSLEEMSQAIAAKLTKEREKCRSEATVELGKLFSEKGELEDRRGTLLAEAAFQAAKNLAKEDIDLTRVYWDHLGAGLEAGNEMRFDITFPCPKEVEELDAKISELNKRISVTKDRAVLDMNSEATSAKEQDIVFLARRLTRQLDESRKAKSVRPTHE